MWSNFFFSLYKRSHVTNGYGIAGGLTKPTTWDVIHGTLLFCTQQSDVGNLPDLLQAPQQHSEEEDETDVDDDMQMEIDDDTGSVHLLAVFNNLLPFVVHMRAGVCKLFVVILNSESVR